MHNNKATKSKKIIVAIAILLTVICVAIAFGVAQSIRYDYLRYDEIPKGYIDYDGHINAGKDYDHILWYGYKNTPALCDEYILVKGNNDIVKKACNILTYNTDESYYVDEYGAVIKDEHTDGYLAEMVSDDDYYIIKSFNSDGDEVEYKGSEFNEENFQLFFYDTQSNTLYNCRWIW